MNILQLYQDYQIPHLTEGNKHCTEGWVNVNCPFCTGSEDFHLGYHINTGHFSCWRCGWHPALDVICKLLGVKLNEAKQIINKYHLLKLITPKKEPLVKIKRKSFKLPMPTNLGFLTERHEQYLENRGFDPEKLLHNWSLMATGPIAMLDNIDYKHRIIVPIYWNGLMVSFQGRDITGKHNLKYMTCPKDRERMFHKSIIFGNHEKWKDTGICVEGVFDVFKLGGNAFATFGIKYTLAQVRLISQLFKRVVVIFDDDTEATKQAKKLVGELKFRKVDAFHVPIQDDPGSLSQDDANYLVKQLKI